jgi:hypothetical protein
LSRKGNALRPRVMQVPPVPDRSVAGYFPASRRSNAVGGHSWSFLRATVSYVPEYQVINFCFANTESVIDV